MLKKQAICFNLCLFFIRRYCKERLNFLNKIKYYEVMCYNKGFCKVV